jgi:DNA-binding winged helix-turn-helix (wHTH) protein/tetratricopeptide (TPR) repeat protein
MRYLFGTFELDAGQYELRKDSRAVHVEPRVLDALFFLVRNRDRIVSREELLDAVWKTKFIGESALSRCIMQARKAVASAADQEPIKTIHRRGYRFVLPVTVEDDEIGEKPAATTPAQPAAPSFISQFDPEAVKLCSRALLLWKKRSPADMRSAIALLHAALELEPDYALAHAALGDCYMFVGFLQQTAPMSVFPKAEAALARAIELDPTLAGAHACRGFIETVYGWNLAAADASLNEALRLDPALAIVHHRRGLLLLTQKRFDQAHECLQKAALLDPLSPIYATACGLPFMAAGRPEEAIPVYRSVIESEPAFFPVHFYLGLALESSGRLEDAIAQFRTAVMVAPTDTEAMPGLAHALSQAGKPEEAREIEERLRAASEQRFISPFFFAVIALGLGEVDRALEHLNEAVSIRAMRMHDLHLDPRFAALREDTRFRALLARIGVDPEITRDAPVRWWSGQRSSSS